jgi:hypothetical protein
MTYTYSFDKKSDRWSELADEFDSMLDELAESESESVFIPVDEFDELEIL